MLRTLMRADAGCIGAIAPVVLGFQWRWFWWWLPGWCCFYHKDCFIFDFPPRWKVNNEEDEGPSAPPADEEDDGVRFGLMMMIVMISMIVMIVGTTKTIVTVMIYYNDHWSWWQCRRWWPRWPCRDLVGTCTSSSTLFLSAAAPLSSITLTSEKVKKNTSIPFREKVKNTLMLFNSSFWFPQFYSLASGSLQSV